MPKIDARLLLPGQQFQVPGQFRDATWTTQRVEVASIDGPFVFVDVAERTSPIQLAIGEEVESIPPAPRFHATWNADSQSWVCLVEYTVDNTNIQVDLNDQTLFDGINTY